MEVADDGVLFQYSVGGSMILQSRRGRRVQSNFRGFILCTLRSESSVLRAAEDVKQHSLNFRFLGYSRLFAS